MLFNAIAWRAWSEYLNNEILCCRPSVWVFNRLEVSLLRGSAGCTS